MAKFARFIDPETKQKLFYNPTAQTLASEKGDVSYPIINGIPRFVPPEFYQESCQPDTAELQTGRSFGDKWSEPRIKALGQTEADRLALKEQFLAMLGCNSLDELKRLFKAARLTLNAGCGVAWSEYLFDLNPETERHCVDLSLAVEVAYKNTAHMPNVTVSQASILELPYPDELFDIVYACGVVHHTKDPGKAVFEIGKKVAPGGILGSYIYNKKPFIRELCDHNIRKHTTKMSYAECIKFSRKMTLLGKALSKLTEPLILKEDIELLGIKAGEYNLQHFIYDYIVKCWYNPDYDDEYADLVNLDWYHPSYASHHTKEEVISWFEAAGFRNLKCLQPSGWEHSGYFISGNKL